MRQGDRSVRPLRADATIIEPRPAPRQLPASPVTPARTCDYGGILASVGEAAYEWRIATDCLTWSDNAAAVLGLADCEAIATNRGFARLLAPDTTETRFDAVMRTEARDEGQGVPYQLQYALQGSAGQPLWLEDTGRWFAGPDGRPRLAHGVVRAINERHAQEERLAYLSRFDSLTGEMNRTHLTEMLGQALEEAVRFRNSCAFLLVAIDHLGRVNEAYGFKVADEVIGAVAKRMRSRMRGGDMLGRFSGNKFGIVLRSCTVEEMGIAAERLLRGVRDEVVQTSCGPIAVTVSIGGVIAPRHARDVQETLARAQEALESAKAKRQDSFFAYRPSVEREALRRENVRATDEIVAALNERRVLLAFEPVVDARTRQPAFYEALMRLRRADGTLVPAAAAIPIAERLGLVRLLDHRMMELVVEELVRYPSIRLSINVSPASTGEPDWWESLCAHLRAHSGVAERLTVEITEIAEIRDIDETRGFVSRVQDLGCRIAIDDFGAGFTSFRNLRKLGVDLIKIDGAFVQNLTRSADDRIFVRTLIGLGRDLKLTTIAEWVQSEEAATQLAAWGCDCLQGALVGLASVERPWANAQARAEGPGAA